MRFSRYSLTYELAEVIADAYSEETDPIAVIVAHAYFFSGLNISTLRHMLVISDEFGTLRTPSKELVRRMISAMRERIVRIARERYGERAFDILQESMERCHTHSALIDLTEKYDTLEQENDTEMME